LVYVGLDVLVKVNVYEYVGVKVLVHVTVKVGLEFGVNVLDGVAVVVLVYVEVITGVTVEVPEVEISPYRIPLPFVPTYIRP